MNREAPPPTLKKVLQEGTALLQRSGSPSPRLDAELLLAGVLKRDRVFLYRESGAAMEKEALERYRGLIGRRQAGEPVAYILGKKEFWSLDFIVDRRVLIPRPDTEVLVEEVIRLFRDRNDGTLSFIDVGTGSGALAVTLARLFPGARVTASDISREALGIAAANSERHGVRRRIDFFRGDLLDAVKGPFDCIVSNPPYIDAGTYARLDPGVRDFEPAGALLAGPEGIECHRALAVQAKARLRPGGWLVMEAGEGQGDRIRGLLEACGAYEDIFFRKDYGGRERVVAARRS